MHHIKRWIILLPALVISACMAPGPFPRNEPDTTLPLPIEVDRTEVDRTEPARPQPVQSQTNPLAEPLSKPAQAGETEIATHNSAQETAGPTPEQQAILDGLRNAGSAPELTNETWLNSAPLTLADLRGKVVLVEFWTFGCINCRNVLPAMRDWYAKYKELGLEIVGVHTPEFSYEKDLANVEDALVRLEVDWPVAIDNDWKVWRSYNNHYWPAMYFVDKTGNVRHLKIGEGQYEHTESIIQALLAERP